jgi:hypothetical protein
MAKLPGYETEYRNTTLPILQALGLDQACLSQGFIITGTDSRSVTVEWVQLMQGEHGAYRHPMRSTISVVTEAL